MLTAGSEGIIRVWYIPSPEEISELPDMDSLELSYAIVTAHDETIWDLQYHPCDVRERIEYTGMIDIGSNISCHRAQME